MDPVSQFLNGAQVSGTEIVGAKHMIQQAAAGLYRVACGIPRSSIAAAGSYDAVITPTDPFKPEALVLSTAAQGLDVTQVKIGSKPLNITSNPISGNCFAENSVASRLEGYTAQPGVGFTVSFTNNTAGAIYTGGGVFGWAAL